MLIGRRRALAGSVVAGAVPVLGLSPAWGAVEAGRLSFGGFGGIFDTAMNALRAPLKAQAGLELDKTAAGSQILLAKLQASQGQPPFDAVMMTAEAMLMGSQKGLLQTVTPATIPNMSAIQKRILAPFQVDGGYCSAPVHWKVIGILWRHDLVPFEIKSWRDLWRPELRNRISIQNMPTLGGALMLIAAAIAHGGSQTNLEPGWKALAALRPNVRDFFAISSNAMTSLVAGDTWVTVNTLDLGLPLVGKNVTATVPLEGIGYSPEGLGFPKSAPNAANALKFGNFMLEQQTQLEWAKLADVAPSTHVAVPPDLQKSLVEDEAMLGKLFDIDFLGMGQNMQAWAERWRQDVVG